MEICLAGECRKTIRDVGVRHPFEVNLSGFEVEVLLAGNTTDTAL